MHRSIRFSLVAIAATAILALGLPGCGGDDEPADGGQGDTATAADNAAGGGADGPTEDGAGGGGLLPDLGIGRGGADPGPATETGGGDPGAATPDAVTPDTATGGGNLPEGRFVDLIRGDRFPKLVIELDVVAGKDPRAASKTALVQRLGALLDKPGGIEIVDGGGVTSRGSDYAWSFAELDQLAKDTFDLDVADDAIKIHVLFLDGHSDQDSGNGRVLGLAWGWTHLVMFSDSIAASCRGGLGLQDVCAETELGVWLHEVGHLIGLVDNGLPMIQPHKDEDHGAHDVSDDCIMYWAYEGSGAADALRTRLLGGQSGPPPFDERCKEDIAAIRDATR